MLCTQEDYKICGIVSAIGRLGATEEGAFRDLLILDVLRGEDSTGIASVNSHGEVRVDKQVGNTFELLNMHRTDEIWKQQNRILIGHNRFATTGLVNKRNAHPFEFDGLVGVHNGTLKQRFTLKYQNKYTVDSEQLFANIDEDGEEEVIPKVDGAYALMWWDKFNEEVKFIRNDQRPLYYTLGKDNKTLFTASEAWMLSVALSRNKVAHNEIVEVPVDTLHRIPLDYTKPYGMFEDITIHRSPLKKKIVEEVKKKNGQTSATTHGWGEWVGTEKISKAKGLCTDLTNNKYIECRHPVDGIEIRLYLPSNIEFSTSRFANFVGKYVQGKVHGYNPGMKYYLYSIDSIRIIDIAENEEEKKDNNSVVLEFPVRDHNNVIISKYEFDKRYASCAYCSSDIEYGSLYKPLSHDSCLCAECSTSPVM